jgi:hypothetical protein
MNKIVQMPRINYFKLRESNTKDNTIFKDLNKQGPCHMSSMSFNASINLLESKKTNSDQTFEEEISIAEEFGENEFHVAEDLQLRAKIPNLPNLHKYMSSGFEIDNSRPRSISDQVPVTAGLFNRGSSYATWQRNFIKNISNFKMHDTQIYTIPEIVCTEKDSGCESTCYTAMVGNGSNIQNKQQMNRSIFAEYDWKDHFRSVVVEETKIVPTNHGKKAKRFPDKLKEKIASITAKTLHKCSSTAQPLPKAPHKFDIEDQHYDDPI